MSDSSTDGTEQIAYEVTYQTSAKVSGMVPQKTKTVKCADVVVSDGIVRFQDESGDDVFSVGSDCLLRYERTGDK